MRVVMQRVSGASVEVARETVASIGRGLLVLLGVETGDTEREASALAGKIARLRVFPDDAKPMNVSVSDIGGEVLVVSQFTLAGDVSGGNRPSFLRAAAPDEAERLYGVFVEAVRAEGVPTRTGKFAAHMEVSLVNDGPVTLVLSVRPGGSVGN